MLDRNLVSRFILIAAALVGSLSFAQSAWAAGQLPSDFEWGVANATVQVEGGMPPSNWSVYPQIGKIKEDAGRATDFWHRYPEDIQLAKRLGVTTFRYGIAWPRVEPAENVWDEAAFKVYDDMLAKVKAAGMKPMITLFHWDYPKRLMPGGTKSAFGTPGFVDSFMDFARKVIDRYKGQGITWMTVNEPESVGVFETRYGNANPVDVQRQLGELHSRTYDYIKQVDPQAKVTASTAWFGLRSEGVEPVALDYFIQPMLNKLDFFSLQYYYDANLSKPNDLVKLLGGMLQGELWSNPLDPPGFGAAIDYWAKRMPGKPIVITENGMPTKDGEPRSDGYLRCQHVADMVHQIQLKRDAGVPITGYIYWSLTDNWEWGSFSPAFGLYRVDARNDPSLKRVPTDAVPTYKALIQNGGVAGDYQPVKTSAGFSSSTPAKTCMQPKQLQTSAQILAAGKGAKKSVQAKVVVENGLAPYTVKAVLRSKGRAVAKLTVKTANANETLRLKMPKAKKVKRGQKLTLTVQVSDRSEATAKTIVTGTRGT